MRHRTLQEAAKFLSGVIAADFFALLWFSQAGIFPVNFYGLTFTPGIILPGAIFDVAVFLILVHYGWHVGKIPAPRERTYLTVAGIVFSLVALAHLWRLFSNAPLELGGWEIPLWLSWFGVLIAAYLAYTSFHFATRPRRRQ
jgi:hypothetical protein